MKESSAAIKFRYSNRFFYYLIWLGGWMSWGVAVFFYGEAISQVCYAIIDRYDTAGFVGVMLAIVVSYIACFMFFFLIARRVTDKHGEALFYDEYVEIYMGRRTFKIVYENIKRLKYRTVLNAQHGGVGFGPMLYRLHIKTDKRKLIIPGSFKEAWECKKNDDARPELYSVAMEVWERSGVDMKFVSK